MLIYAAYLRYQDYTKTTLEQMWDSTPPCYRTHLMTDDTLRLKYKLTDSYTYPTLRQTEIAPEPPARDTPLRCQAELCRTKAPTANNVRWRHDYNMVTCDRCNKHQRRLAQVLQLQQFALQNGEHTMDPHLLQELKTLPSDWTRSQVAGPLRNNTFLRLGNEPGACTALWAAYLSLHPPRLEDTIREEADGIDYHLRPPMSSDRIPLNGNIQVMIGGDEWPIQTWHTGSVTAIQVRRKKHPNTSDRTKPGTPLAKRHKDIWRQGHIRPIDLSNQRTRSSHYQFKITYVDDLLPASEPLTEKSLHDSFDMWKSMSKEDPLHTPQQPPDFSHKDTGFHIRFHDGDRAVLTTTQLMAYTQNDLGHLNLNVLPDTRVSRNHREDFAQRVCENNATPPDYNNPTISNEDLTCGTWIQLYNPNPPLFDGKPAGFHAPYHDYEYDHWEITDTSPSGPHDAPLHRFTIERHPSHHESTNLRVQHEINRPNGTTTNAQSTSSIPEKVLTYLANLKPTHRRTHNLCSEVADTLPFHTAKTVYECYKRLHTQATPLISRIIPLPPLERGHTWRAVRPPEYAT